MRVLILTDHTLHTVNNSLYDISAKFCLHPKVKIVDIASRAISLNNGFFSGDPLSGLWATRIDPNFHYEPNEHPLNAGHREVDLSRYDLIWLRLPPPLEGHFLKFIQQMFIDRLIINRPESIHITGSKEFLMNFQHLCPPMKICRSLDDIEQFRNRFPIVLKRFRGYGGQGLIRIEGDSVWKDNKWSSFDNFKAEINANDTEYLAVKFLRNVSQGDKRIVVINGEVIGASLRIPAKNSWLCNVALGGTSVRGEVTEEEYQILAEINPVLLEMGIVMYGIDTLVDDNGKRVLSELNTTSVGGLSQIAAFRQRGVIERSVDLIVAYYNKHKK